MNLLNSTFPKQSGFSGQIVFYDPKGTVSAQQSAIDQSVSNVAKLPDVIKAVSPFASAESGAVAKDGTIAYASVGWDVNPDSLDTAYLDKLNSAVAPARSAGLHVEYGAGAGEIGQKSSDITSEVVGLACALVLLLIMLVPAFMGLVKQGVRALTARVRALKEGQTAQEQAAATASATHERHEHSAFARWGRMVSTHPWPWAVAGVVVLVVLAIPLFSLTLGQPDNGTNPTSDSSRRAYDLISQGFGVGTNGPLTLVVKLPNQSSADNSSLLSSMQSDISKTAGVASVTPPAINSSGTTAVFNVIPTTRPQATQTATLINTLRADVLPKQHATAFVTGATAGAVDFTHQITSRLVWLILAVVALSFILLTVAFRSVVIATKAAILNLLSIGAAYGVIVAILEWGWGKSLIGLQSTLPIPAYVPMLGFCIVFGLSMDYEVFLLSRVHEVWLDTLDAHRSVAIGISATARAITTAAAIMVVVFTSFVLDPEPTIKMLAIGMAFAVLIASVVRMCLVPSIMSLLGAHAWWLPRWLEPVVPKVQLEESVPEPEVVA